MFLNILVPVDGSESADAALSQAIDLASSQGSAITLLCAWRRLSLDYSLGVAMSEADIESLDGEARTEAERIVATARARIPEGIVTHTLVVEGHPADAILDAIQAREPDLVMMGSRGRGSVRSTLLGSVSQSVLHHSPAPVLIMRHTAVRAEPILAQAELDVMLSGRDR